MLAARRSAMLRSCSVEVTAPAILRAPDARVRSGPDRRGYPARDGIHIDHRRACTRGFLARRAARIGRPRARAAVRRRSAAAPTDLASVRFDAAIPHGNRGGLHDAGEPMATDLVRRV